MGRRDGLERLRRVLLLAVCVPVAAGCSSADIARDRAEEQLAQGLHQAHGRALAERAADPSGRDRAAAARLGAAVSGGGPAAVVATAVTPQGVEVITTLGVLVEAGGGLTYTQASLGACLRTTATAGSGAGDAPGRGTVETEAVPCPQGVVPAVRDVPVEAVTTDLRGRRSSVPAPRSACLSGSGECVGG